jgi:hypothetical protein
MLGYENSSATSSSDREVVVVDTVNEYVGYSNALGKTFRGAENPKSTSE